MDGWMGYCNCSYPAQSGPRRQPNEGKTAETESWHGTDKTRQDKEKNNISQNYHLDMVENERYTG